MSTLIWQCAALHVDSETPLFVSVIEYEYDMVIGYAYDMGSIHRVYLSYFL